MRLVLLFGVASLFADMTYEGGLAAVPVLIRLRRSPGLAGR